MPGNRLRVLRDARENYPAWAAAIESARRTIHLEMYIVHDDATGQRFRDALVARAKAGVTVRVLYDWFGSLRLVGRGFWAPLRAAGGEVRVANPPSLDSLLGWASRDHRKLLTVDGAEAFISGLCIGDAWAGDPARGIAPWRDTGVQLAGPAVADAEAAFAAAWALAGPPIAPVELPRREDIPAAGTVTLRVIASAPETTELYRMDLLVAVAARERLWLTDAYFMATPPYRQALRSAALDGVDVRLLVPHGSDIEWIANAPAQCIGRCWRRACVSSSGTARWCTQRRRWPTGAGPVSVPRTSTSRAGSATGSSTWVSRTRESPARWRISSSTT